MLGWLVDHDLMKVLLLGNYANDGQESMQRFSAFMAQGLMQAGHEVRLLRPPSVIGQLRPSWDGVGKWLGYVDKFVLFPVLLKSAVKQADVVHICDHANSFYTKYLSSVANLVTCHDLLAIRSAQGEFPQNRTGWTGQRLQALIVKNLMAAQHIACVSDATRKDLMRIVGIHESRVSRVYNSLNYPYSRMDTIEAASRLRRLAVDPDQPFLLHVGGNQWYKNRMGVLRILAALRKLTISHDVKLVMVGKPWTAEMRRFVTENKLTNATKELTSVADEDLRALYSVAALLLFPSLEEGFGWPIIEAQACGCPVATSKRSPMDEVAGEEAIYLDPENPSAAAIAVRDGLDKLTTMREASLQNAARFTTGMIDAYIALYEQLHGDKRAGVRNHRLVA